MSMCLEIFQPENYSQRLEFTSHCFLSDNRFVTQDVFFIFSNFKVPLALQAIQGQRLSEDGLPTIKSVEIVCVAQLRKHVRGFLPAFRRKMFLTYPGQPIVCGKCFQIGQLVRVKVSHGYPT